MRGELGLLKTFLLSHVALVSYFVIGQIIAMQLPQRRGEFENSSVPLYYLAVIELLGIFLLYSFWNAIKNYEGKKLWLILSKLYAFFVSQCVLLPLYIAGYMIYLSQPMQ